MKKKRQITERDKNLWFDVAKWHKRPKPKPTALDIMYTLSLKERTKIRK